MENEHFQAVNYLIQLAQWIGGIMVAAGVGMAYYIIHQSKMLARERKENKETNEKHLVTMVEAMTNNTRSTDSNTEVLHEMKSLLHTVKDQLLTQGKRK